MVQADQALHCVEKIYSRQFGSEKESFPRALFLQLSFFLSFFLCKQVVNTVTMFQVCFFTLAPAEELHAKGYDSFVILQWLRCELDTTPPPQSCRKLSSCVWCADTFMTILCGAEPFLADDEVQNVQTVGNAFLKVFLSLHNDQPHVWRIRPKFHLLWHVVNDPALRPAKRNSSLDSTWLDEDWIKKIQRVLRKCHKVTAPKTLLQRYLVALRSKLTDYSEKIVWPVHV